MKKIFEITNYIKWDEKERDYILLSNNTLNIHTKHTTMDVTHRDDRDDLQSILFLTN